MSRPVGTGAMRLELESGERTNLWRQGIFVIKRGPVHNQFKGLPQPPLSHTQQRYPTHSSSITLKPLTDTGTHRSPDRNPNVAACHTMPCHASGRLDLPSSLARPFRRHLARTRLISPGCVQPLPWLYRISTAERHAISQFPLSRALVSGSPWLQPPRRPGPSEMGRQNASSGLWGSFLLTSTALHCKYEYWNT